MEVLTLLVKFDCPHCNKEKYISLLTDTENIVLKDRDKLTSCLYDHIDVNDIFFSEELIDEILNVLSKTEIKEINLHKILVDTFVTADCC
jgi:transcription elongation factor Elf1